MVLMFCFLVFATMGLNIIELQRQKSNLETKVYILRDAIFLKDKENALLKRDLLEVVKNK